MAKKAVLPTELEEAFAEDSGSGFEGITTSDLQIPFIRIINALSPQIDKDDSANFIKGSSAGDIFNTVTKQMWEGDEGVVVLPSIYHMKLLEFVPRSEGGGFVGELSADSADVRTRTLAWNCCLTETNLCVPHSIMSKLCMRTKVLRVRYWT